MGKYRDRVGQRIGSLEVLEDYKRTKRGKVIWRCYDHRTGLERYLHTWDLIKLDREHLARLAREASA